MGKDIKNCPECRKEFPMAKIELIKSGIQLGKKSFSTFNVYADTYCKNCKKRVVIWENFTNPKNPTIKIPI